jgi:VWFA-related protein
MNKFQSGVCWTWPALIILFAFWALGAFHASGTISASEAPKAQNKEQEKDKDSQENQEAFSFKINVNLVTTDVTVTGRPVSELKAEDFVILDNGASQPITLFSLDQLPIAVALLIDASESIRPFLPMLQLSGLSALRHLKPEDQAVLYSFSAMVRRHTDLTGDRLLIADNLPKIEVKFGTALYDAIVDASKFLYQKAPNSRRVIILISDNYRVGGALDAQSALVSLLETSTTLYDIRALSVVQSLTPDWAQSDEAISVMVNQTGGSLFDVRAPIALQQVLSNAINNIRKQYTLGFSPVNPGKPGTFHKLDVGIMEKRCPGCRIRTRKGYYSGKSSPGVSDAVNNTPAISPEQTDDLLARRIITALATADFEMTDLDFSSQYAEATDDKGNPVLKLNLKIPIRQLAFTTEGGRRAFKLRIGVFSFANGRFLWQDLRPIRSSVSEEEYRSGMQGVIPYSIIVPRPAERHQLRIVVLDDDDDRAGSKAITIPERRIVIIINPKPKPN